MAGSGQGGHVPGVERRASSRRKPMPAEADRLIRRLSDDLEALQQRMAVPAGNPWESSPCSRTK
ncbi:MAG: hypothetical protein MZV70_65850 [Desulfobacterales bacterium]|nr:hypothetical protein [Desulfobacterales bacterium]